jgi:hypothetical protein
MHEARYGTMAVLAQRIAGLRASEIFGADRDMSAPERLLRVQRAIRLA